MTALLATSCMACTPSGNLRANTADGTPILQDPRAVPRSIHGWQANPGPNHAGQRDPCGETRPAAPGTHELQPPSVNAPKTRGDCTPSPSEQISAVYLCLRTRKDHKCCTRYHKLSLESTPMHYCTFMPRLALQSQGSAFQASRPSSLLSTEQLHDATTSCCQKWQPIGQPPEPGTSSLHPRGTTPRSLARGWWSPPPSCPKTRCMRQQRSAFSRSGFDFLLKPVHLKS